MFIMMGIDYLLSPIAVSLNFIHSIKESSPSVASGVKNTLTFFDEVQIKVLY